LLVVIGIIGILIAILVPALNAARRQARLVQCSSNLQQIAVACLNHAQEHRGFVPLAGHITAGAEGKIDLPAGLNDAGRHRYDYCKAPTGIPVSTVVVPLPIALAPYLGFRKISGGAFAEVDAIGNDLAGSPYRHFLCPAADHTAATKRGLFVSLGVEGINTNFPFWGWSIPSDYGYNESVFGFYINNEIYRNRYRGHLARMRRQSEMMLMADAAEPSRAYPFLASHLDLSWRGGTYEGAITLGSALLPFEPDKASAYGPHFDAQRHRGRVNIAFVDGHVGTYLIRKAELDAVYVVPK
jgi:prepilin-type processing-associated H-X9-DG protein